MSFRDFVVIILINYKKRPKLKCGAKKSKSVKSNKTLNKSVSSLSSALKVTAHCFIMCHCNEHGKTVQAIRVNT